MRILIFFILFISSFCLSAQSNAKRNRKLINQELNQLRLFDSLSTVYGQNVSVVSVKIVGDSLVKLIQVVQPCAEYPNGKWITIEKRSIK
jgi:hypothetical protein